MADVDGYFFPMDGYYGKKYKANLGKIFNSLNPAGTQFYYRMRAWNTVTLSYEIWTSMTYPNLNPPSGDPVTEITIIGIWKGN